MGRATFGGYFQADQLLPHPEVADIEVFGVVDKKIGEIAQTVLQSLDWQQADPSPETNLRAECRTNHSAIKTPKLFDSRPTLPRAPTGKLLKRLLKDEYQAAVSKYEVI